MVSEVQKQRLYSLRASVVRAPGVPFCTSRCSLRKNSGSAPIICSGNGAFWIRKNHHMYLGRTPSTYPDTCAESSQSPRSRLCGLPLGDLSTVGELFWLRGRENP